MASYYWIKLYHEILDDPKMGRLPDRAWRRCIELFLLAGDAEQDGALPSLEDIAWRLNISEAELSEDLQILESAGLIVQDNETGHIVNFTRMQGRGKPKDQILSYMRKDWYRKYLSSKHWKETRKRALESAGHRCENCGIRGHRKSKYSEAYEQYCAPCDNWSLYWNLSPDLKCPYCGISLPTIVSLHVHHLTYENLGNEADEDLLVLCKDCHREIHGYIETEVEEELGEKRE